MGYLGWVPAKTLGKDKNKYAYKIVNKTILTFFFEQHPVYSFQAHKSICGSMCPLQATLLFLKIKAIYFEHGHLILKWKIKKLIEKIYYEKYLYCDGNSIANG